MRGAVKQRKELRQQADHEKPGAHLGYIALVAACGEEGIKREREIESQGL